MGGEGKVGEVFGSEELKDKVNRGSREGEVEKVLGEEVSGGVEK